MLFERTRQLERQEALDPLVRGIDERIPAFVLREDVREQLAGRFLGHALHPPLTDVPVGAWVSASVIDVVGPNSWRGVSRFLIALGLASSVPTMASGLVEFRTAGPRERRVIAVHAMANAAAALCYAVSFVAKRSDHRRAGRPSSLAGAAFLAIGGYLGGHLTYVLGVGVDPRARGRQAMTDRLRRAARAA